MHHAHAQSRHKPVHLAVKVAQFQRLTTAVISASGGGSANGVVIPAGTGVTFQRVGTAWYAVSPIPALTGTTGSLGGSSLALNACSSTTISVLGAATTMSVIVTSQSDPNGAGTQTYRWYGLVSAADTVTVNLCAIQAGTPTAKLYNVRVIQ